MILVAVFLAIGVFGCRCRRCSWWAIPVSLGMTILVMRRGGEGMNSDGNPVWRSFGRFGLMSLFAVGGANSAIPEMHRVAVDVQHWMNDKQFADLFAISQLSPGPNVLIVTLIGYSVAGIAGALGRYGRRCADRPPCLPIM